jgi:hypothetical protein
MARNNGEFVTGAYSVDKGDSTDYYHGLGQNAVGTASGAHMTVSHPEYSIRYYNQDRYGNEADDYDLQMWARHQSDKDGNVPLFTETHTPAKFNYAMATKDASVHAGKLGLHAVADIERRFGQRPVASDNTSSFSTPVVNQAIKSGIIKGVYGEPEGQLARQSNDYDWAEAHDNIQKTNTRLRDAIDNGYSSVTPIDLATIDADARALTKQAGENRRTSKRQGRLASLAEGISDSAKAKSTPQQMELF